MDNLDNKQSEEDFIPPIEYYFKTKIILFLSNIEILNEKEIDFVPFAFLEYSKCKKVYK